jgi:hypothetical protein
MHRLLSRAVLATLVAVILPFAAIGTGPVNAGPAYMVGKAALSDFNTTLTGTTADGKHTVAINVNWDSLIKTHVNLVVSVDKGTGSLSALNGSSYTFTLPIKDFTLTANSAILDTHTDLGKFGHITAHWTYVTKSETTTCFSVSTTQHVIAAGSATFNLSFPCDGAIAGKISGSNVDSDNATQSSEGSRSSAYNGLPSLLFTAATAQHTSKGIDLEIGAYQFGSQGNIVYVSIGAGNGGNDATSSTSTNAATGLTSTEFGLTQYSHFASDTLTRGSLTTGQNPAASLHYKGILGTANLVWHDKSGGNFSITMQGNCLNKALTGDAAKASIVFSTQQATLSGSANVKTCVADTATFASTDSGGVISTHKGTAPAGGTTIPGAPTPTPGTGGGTSVGTGNFAVSNITPANGATGVSTSPTISVTFSGAPGKTVEVILIQANNPAGVVMLPPPSVSGNTITTTPATPLTANTEYKLTVVAQGAAGGFVTSNTTFTTGN